MILRRARVSSIRNPSASSTVTQNTPLEMRASMIFAMSTKRGKHSENETSAHAEFLSDRLHVAIDIARRAAGACKFLNTRFESCSSCSERRSHPDREERHCTLEQCNVTGGSWLLHFNDRELRFGPFGRTADRGCFFVLTFAGNLEPGSHVAGKKSHYSVDDCQ